MRFLFVAVFVLGAYSFSYSQGAYFNPPVMAGSQAEHAARVEQRMRGAIAAEKWRQAIKLHHPKTEIPGWFNESPISRPGHLRVGDRGYMEAFDYQVISVVGPEEILVSSNGSSLWMTDCDASTIAEGSTVRLVGLIEITGTKQYQSRTGPRTVLKGRFCSPAEMAKHDAEQEAERKRQAEEKLFRTWSARKSESKIEARYAGFKDGYITLIKRDKTEVRVKPWQLSLADQNHFRELLKETQKPKSAKEK